VDPQGAQATTVPALDEAMFQQILQAAFIIQEQNDVVHFSKPKLDAAATLAIIAETQDTLRSLDADLGASSKLIVERLGKITHATGIAAAVIQGNQIEYCAASGTASRLTGSHGPIGSSLSELLREGNGSHTADDLNTDSNNPAFFPVYAEGKIVGLLQLDFAESESIQEHEIQSCQVMAGLMGEAIARAAEVEWKQALAQERATMLEALERLKPQLERLTAEPPKNGQRPRRKTAPKPKPAVAPRPAPSVEPLPDISDLLAQLNEEPARKPEAISYERTPELGAKPVDAPSMPEPAWADEIPTQKTDSSHTGVTCAQCGFQFAEGEMFCGRCGTPRPMALPTETAAPSADIQVEPQVSAESAEPNYFHQISADESSLEPSATTPEQELVQFVPAETPKTDGSVALALDHLVAEGEAPAAEEEGKGSTLELVPQPEKIEPQSNWTSAAKARHWLESLQERDSPARLWMHEHLGDLSLLLAVGVLVVAFLARTPSPKVKAHPKAPAQPSLTLFERALVGLGLAEPPPSAPTYVGNPNVQVWEDVHTALYYCSGSELYEKTPGGKLTTQRDAQLDQFEPAARRACE